MYIIIHKINIFLPCNSFPAPTMEALIYLVNTSIDLKNKNVKKNTVKINIFGFILRIIW